jgi:hypothetical protein
MSKKISIAKRAPMVTAPLFIDGISRAGKFLMSDLLQGFSGIEPVQTHTDMDSLHFLTRLKLIEPKTAQEFLQLMVDVYSYETLVGRNLNFRKSDKSYILNHPCGKKLALRCSQPDGQVAFKKIASHKLRSLFIMHELMPNIKTSFDTFSGLQVVSMLRNPIDLVYSWYTRDYCDRESHDPLYHALLIEGKREPIPWYALDWQDEYHKLSQMDRIIRCVDTLNKMNRSSFNRLSAARKKKILFVSYENIMVGPRKEIKRIEKFLGKKINAKDLNLVFKNQKLPNLKRLTYKDERVKVIKKHATEKYYKKLIAMESKYSKDKL